jgi:hypothetical protein
MREICENDMNDMKKVTIRSLTNVNQTFQAISRIPSQFLTFLVGKEKLIFFVHPQIVFGKGARNVAKRTRKRQIKV